MHLMVLTNSNSMYLLTVLTKRLLILKISSIYKIHRAIIEKIYYLDSTFVIILQLIYCFIILLYTLCIYIQVRTLFELFVTN